MNRKLVVVPIHRLGLVYAEVLTEVGSLLKSHMNWARLCRGTRSW